MKYTVLIERAGHTKRSSTIMTRGLLLLAVCLPAALAGCTRTVSEAQLIKLEHSAMAEKFGYVKYLGSTPKHDYFEVLRALGAKRYRVAMPNNLLRPPYERFPYGEGHRESWSSFGGYARLLETQSQDLEAQDGDVVHHAPGHTPPN